MALDQDTINAQLDLLTQHRRRLAHLFQQQATFGAYTPHYIVADIEEAQAAVRNLKLELRAAGVAVEDEPNDDARPASVTAPSRLTPQQQRNRRAMLTKVKTIWIDGLLEQSLAKELRIALDLTEQPDAVDLPLNALVQELRRPPRELPAGTPIIQVFEQMGGALLILGAPGAGKTTLLLELARDLIERAQQDESHPVPVVFNLSSWAAKRQPLKGWLVEELNTKYDVPYKLAQNWNDADALLPLLDGLDEMAPEHRGACVEAINAYRQEHGLVPLAVCSRAADYEALTTKLRLQGAIVVQPLTRQPVDTYLERAGEKLKGVRAALRADVVLWEMLETPLMLSIVALAYKDKPPAELQGGGTPDERRRNLFDAYITAMFQRRSKQTDYTRQQTTYWLSWLADKMVEQSQTVFYIERMQQPDWLPPQQLRLPSRLVFWLLGGLVFGLRGVLLGGTLGTFFFGRYGALLGGLLGGLVGWLLGGDRERAVVVERLRWSWLEAWPVLRARLLGGLLGGLGVGLVCGLLGVLVFGLRSGLISGLIFWLIFWLGFGLVGGLVGGLAGGLAAGLSGDEIEARTTPNQGIRRSVQNWLVFGLSVGLVGGLVGGLLGWLGGGRGLGLGFGLVFGLGFGLVFGLLGGLDYGGRAVLEHYTLRWLLYRNGYLPLRLVPFLDYCVERIFLRKVGGGYIFIHRLLMEHFASLYNEQSSPEPAKAETIP